MTDSFHTHLKFISHSQVCTHCARAHSLCKSCFVLLLLIASCHFVHFDRLLIRIDMTAFLLDLWLNEVMISNRTFVSLHVRALGLVNDLVSDEDGP